MGFLSKLLTVGENKQMKHYRHMADTITAFEADMQAKSDEELRALTVALKERVSKGESLNEVLPEAFAAVREAADRSTGMRHFDVQLIGGIVLHEGKIAEMKTGEGKTLVSTLAGYLNALSGNNVHIVTVNDYLARRDSEWMGRIYRTLGLTVGLIQNGMRPEQRRSAYEADVTYGTNSEFGFDYLRDNMVTRSSMRVQRGHYFAIVDEVDSILIDEARTPLIISGAGMQAAATYNKFARIMPALREGVDFEKDEAKRTIIATEVGLEKIEGMLGIDDLYSDPSGQLPNHLQQALKAQFLFHRDVDYVVVDGEVKIVDEFTGRIMEGRRYSEGLHQALEAKEKVLVRDENQTLATITLQNYFRLYEKLAGMTGTAMTEDAEFRQIYNLSVVAIPSNKPVIRTDENDLVYRTIEAKFNAVADEVEERHHAGQPCLIGTVSIESSEKLSRLLSKRGISHETLNAKNHEREAHIIAQAGRVGAVTIATNMAGRGTDILLGGNPEVLAEDVLRSRGLDPSASPCDEEGNPNPDFPTEEQRAEALAEAKRTCTAEHDQVLEAGGLAVIGTERHESRRIDNQLRGRSGRQGDPGSSQFYLSLEDDLMRLFAGDRMASIARMMEKTKIPDDTPIQASLVSKAVESAQRQVESMHFAARKNVLEYDDVMNKQRAAIYVERNSILDGKDLSERAKEMIDDAVKRVVTQYCSEKTAPDDWDTDAVDAWVAELTGTSDFKSFDTQPDEPEELIDSLVSYVYDIYQRKTKELTEPIMRTLQSQVMLRIIDTRWMAHLQAMDYLKAGIGLRAFAQRDPLTEYREEAYEAFGALTHSMYEDFLRTILRLKIAAKPNSERGSGGLALSIATSQEKSPLDGKVSYSSPERTLEASGILRAQMALRARSAQTASKQEGNLSTAADQTALKPAAGKPQTYIKDKDDPFADVGRNDPCPCGSGLKYKKCHGR